MDHKKVDLISHSNESKKYIVSNSYQSKTLKEKVFPSKTIDENLDFINPSINEAKKYIVEQALIPKELEGKVFISNGHIVFKLNSPKTKKSSNRRVQTKKK